MHEANHVLPSGILISRVEQLVFITDGLAPENLGVHWVFWFEVCVLSLPNKK